MVNQKDGHAPVLSSYTSILGGERCLLSREKNRVDHVDNTVGSFNVRNDDFHSIVQEDLAVFHSDGHILTRDGGSAGEVDHVRSHYLARDNMIEQDVRQLLFVFRQKQAVQSTSGQCREGIIGRGKDREWTFTVQSLNQFSSFESSHEGGEAS